MTRSITVKLEDLQHGGRHLLKIRLSQSPGQPDDLDSDFACGRESLLWQYRLSLMAFALAAKVVQEEKVMRIDND